MKKLFFYSLLVVSAFTSCKKDDPEPSANVEGKWNLSTADIAINSIVGPDEETIDFQNQGVYLDLKSGNKFSANMLLTKDFNNIIKAGDMYESDYEMKGNELTLKIYDADYKSFIPIKLKVETSTGSQLVLKATKSDLAETVKTYDELEGNNNLSQMFAVVSSLDVVLTFSK